jgi:hypothetical protein
MNPRRRRINRQRRLDRAAVLAAGYTVVAWAVGLMRVRRFSSPRINGRMVYSPTPIWRDT